MKKMLIAMLVLMMAASAFAVNPVGKGMMYVEGTTSAGFAKGGGDAYKDFNGDTPTWINFNPSAGYFFANGLAVGVMVNFDKMSWGDTKSTGFHFGPKVMWFPTAKNAEDPKGKLLPYLSAAFLLTSDKTEIEDNILEKLARASATTTYKYSGTEITFTGGGVWMLSNNFGLNLEAFFSLGSEKQKEPVETDSVSGNVMGINIGVTGFFGGGQ